ncbi:hypothetical protein J1614_002723 [Plenodomus biglobosus]|nr:hypothetical protein J1614_002723 [Plenodomus biglobosus]
MSSHKRKASSPLPSPHTSHKPTNPMASIPVSSDACLSKLPEELLVNIFKNLEEDDKLGSLASLCQVNWRFRRIVEEVMFTNLTTASMPAKVLKLAIDPTLTTYLKQMSLNLTPWMDHEPVANRVNAARVLLDAVNLRALQITEPEAPRRYDSGLYSRTATRLAYMGWLGSLITAVSCFAPLPMNRQPPNTFSHLKQLEIHTLHVSAQRLQPVFSLPALVSLQLVEVQQPKPLRDWTVHVGSSSIRHLTLHRTYMHIDAVAAMIRSCKALQCLTYVHDGCRWLRNAHRSHPRSIYATQSWAVLGNALRMHADSLYWLRANMRFGHRGPPNRQAELGVLGSLLEFRCLHAVNVPIDALIHVFGWPMDLRTVLPPHLDSLSLFCSTIWRHEYLTDYVAAFAGVSSIVTRGHRIVSLALSPGARGTARIILEAIFAWREQGLTVGNFERPG